MVISDLLDRSSIAIIAFYARGADMNWYTLKNRVLKHRDNADGRRTLEGHHRNRRHSLFM